jgi:DNA-binding NarL/FixJ family response regulator
VKILVADDHPVMREGFKMLLQEYSEFTSVFEAKNGQEACEILLKNDIDVATIDIEMPVMGGFDVARRISDKQLGTKIVFLTMHKDEQIFHEAMDVGASGYVLKDNAVDDIVESIRCVMNGGYYVSPALTHLILTKNRARKEFNTYTLKDLTKMERTVLKLISESKTTREIASELFISYKTVENHRSNIARKLKLQGAHSLVKFAIINKSIL